MKKLGSYAVLLPLFVTLVAHSPSVYAQDNGNVGNKGGFLSRWLGRNQIAEAAAPTPPQAAITVDHDNLPHEALDKFTENWTQKAANGEFDPFIGGAAEIQQLTDAIDVKKSTFLVGEAGDGKTAGMEELARVLLEVDPNFRVYTLKTGEFIGNSNNDAEAARNLESILEELKLRNGKALLFIDEVHELMQKSIVRNLLKPAMARRQVLVFGATTLEEYKLMEADTAFISRTTKVIWQKMTQTRLAEILRGRKSFIERDTGLHFMDDALSRIAQAVFRDFAAEIPSRKAFDIVDRAFSIIKSVREGRPRDINAIKGKLGTVNDKINSLSSDLTYLSSELVQQRQAEIEELKSEKLILESEQARILKGNELMKRYSTLQAEQREAIRTQNLARVAQIQAEDTPHVLKELKDLGFGEAIDTNVVSKKVVNLAVGEMSGYSQEFLNESESDRLAKFSARVAGEVRGQSAAAEAIADTLLPNRIRVSRTSGPASMIILGPPSSGKDYLISRTAKYALGSESKVSVISGASYNQGSASIWRLEGSDVGFVDSGKEGTVTGPLRKNPNSIVNVQNFDLMSREAQDVVGGYFDTDTMIDKQGRTVNVGNGIFALSSSRIGTAYPFDKAKVLLGKMPIEELAAKYGQNPAEFATLSWAQRDDRVGRQALRDAHVSDQLLKADKVIFTNVVTYKDILRAANDLLREQVIDLRSTQNMKLEVTRAALTAVARAGYNAQFGMGSLGDSFKEYITRTLSETVGQGAREGSTIRLEFERNGPNERAGKLIVKVNGQEMISKPIAFRSAAEISQEFSNVDNAHLMNEPMVAEAHNGFHPTPGAGIGSNTGNRKVIPVPQKRAVTVRSAPHVEAKAPPASAPKPRVNVTYAPRETDADRRARRAMESAERVSRGTRSGEVDVRTTVERVGRDKK